MSKLYHNKLDPDRRSRAERFLEDDEFEEYDHAPMSHKAAVSTPEPPLLDGVPRLALYIVVFNMGVWFVLVAIMWFGRVAADRYILGITLLAVALVITLALYFIAWKLYWWLLALSASLGTLALAYTVVIVITGGAAFGGIPIPRFLTSVF